MGIDLTLPTPLYQQIVADIKRQIDSGELKEGDQIPSQHVEAARENDFAAYKSIARHPFEHDCRSSKSRNRTNIKEIFPLAAA